MGSVTSQTAQINKKPLRLLDPKCDVVFKKIFGNHPNLVKSFLNGLLRLPGDRVIEKVTYLTPEQAPRIPSLKNTIVDVKCTDQTGAVFIVEMQMSWSASFFKRFLFGASKAFVQQLETGQGYDQLCPVYGLAILNDVFEPKVPEWYHPYRMTHASFPDKALEGIELVFVELPKFTPETFAHRKLGALWLRFLKEAPFLEEIPSDFEENPELLKALDLTQEASYTPEELEFYDQYLDAIRVQKTVRADSFEEGKAEGLAEGRLEEKRAIAKAMVAQGMDPETVFKITGISKDQICGT